MKIGQEINLTLKESKKQDSYVAHSINVTVNKVTEKAINFSIDNTKYNLWFPKSAIILDSESDRMAKVAVWFTFEGFHGWVLNNLTETFSASFSA